MATLKTANQNIANDVSGDEHEEVDIYVREVVPVGSNEEITSGIEYQVLPTISSITRAQTTSRPAAVCSSSRPVSFGSVSKEKTASQKLAVREKLPLTDDMMARCLKEAKKRRAEEEAEDADISFLKSLVPDMKKMNDRQKNRFKRNVLSAIDDILYST